MNVKENHKHKPNQLELPDFSAKTYVGGRQAFEQVILGKLGTYMQKNEARSVVILHKNDYNQSLKGLNTLLEAWNPEMVTEKKIEKTFQNVGLGKGSLEQDFRLLYSKEQHTAG